MIWIEDPATKGWGKNCVAVLCIGVPGGSYSTHGLAQGDAERIMADIRALIPADLKRCDDVLLPGAQPEPMRCVLSAGHGPVHRGADGTTWEAL